MDEKSWRYESKHTIVKASPDLRERFRVTMREKINEEEGRVPSEEEVEEMAALAWLIRAKGICERADVLIEEGVPDEEVRNLLRVEPE